MRSQAKDNEPPYVTDGKTENPATKAKVAVCRVHGDAGGIPTAQPSLAPRHRRPGCSFIAMIKWGVKRIRRQTNASFLMWVLRNKNVAKIGDLCSHIWVVQVRVVDFKCLGVPVSVVRAGLESPSLALPYPQKPCPCPALALPSPRSARARGSGFAREKPEPEAQALGLSTTLSRWNYRGKMPKSDLDIPRPKTWPSPALPQPVPEAQAVNFGKPCLRKPCPGPGIRALPCPDNTSAGGNRGLELLDRSR
ncbi:hypothetical protein BD410DRAFT_805683 [Rickenella mellea]|uniref:Uncharacterized protein n=1 Tax=Rickenella mellea TaxID=50990 RepID=A0A4Y7PW68_9AGAM|nr:hypothetical protein BD410DRAFT_805683 [Rickenella mellea]